jgi:serine protease
MFRRQYGRQPSIPPAGIAPGHPREPNANLHAPRGTPNSLQPAPGAGSGPGRGARLLRRAGVALLSLAAVGMLAGPAVAAVPDPPNDPYFTSQWALRIIKAPQAWSRSTGAGETIAVVDTGVQFGIPDLPQSKSAGSYNCIGEGGTSGPCPADGSGDDNGHGTWVASVAAAETNNGIGMAGVAPDAKILSIKAISADGTGEVTDIAKGIEFAADEGANVINLSVGPDAFGQSFPTLDCPPSTVGGCLQAPVNDSSSLHQALQPAVDYATARGALVIFAAGNTDPQYAGQSLYMGMHNVLIVGATGPNDEVAGYSDTGSGSTFIWAPGGDGSCSQSETANCIILADKSGGYVVSEGTSFATPHVAGVAALLMADGYSNSAAAARIESTADPVSAGPRLDAAAAVGASGAAPVSQPRIVAPVAQSSPQPVLRTSPRPAAASSPAATHPAPSPTPSPSPAPSQTPSPAASPAPSPSPRLAAASTGRTIASRSVSQPSNLEAVALVTVLAAAGGAAAVWFSRRVRV